MDLEVLEAPALPEVQDLVALLARPVAAERLVFQERLAALELLEHQVRVGCLARLGPLVRPESLERPEQREAPVRLDTLARVAALELQAHQESPDQVELAERQEARVVLENPERLGPPAARERAAHLEVLVLREHLERTEHLEHLEPLVRLERREQQEPKVIISGWPIVQAFVRTLAVLNYQLNLWEPQQFQPALNYTQTTCCSVLTIPRPDGSETSTIASCILVDGPGPFSRSLMDRPDRPEVQDFLEGLVPTEALAPLE